MENNLAIINSVVNTINDTSLMFDYAPENCLLTSANLPQLSVLAFARRIFPFKNQEKNFYEIKSVNNAKCLVLNKKDLIEQQAQREIGRNFTSQLASIFTSQRCNWEFQYETGG